MAGTFPGTAGCQQHDLNGVPLVGALLTVYQGGTTALANVYQDITTLLPAPNPLVADQSGRLPFFYVPDGTYALRLTDAFGVQSNGGFYLPQVPSIGASTSGGGATPVDPTTIAQTGDLKWRLENTTIAGWVRLNKKTIGNGSSGASERANSDCQALFIYIWSTYADAMCPVPGGRGASGLADFNAGKQITLLDSRGKDIRGLDDMGNAAAGAFTGVAFQTGTATTGGASCGVNSFTLLTNNLPPYTPSGTVFSNGSAAIQTAAVSGSPVTQLVYEPGGSSGTTTLPLTIISGFNGSPQGGTSAPIPSVPSALLGTLFWKL